MLLRQFDLEPLPAVRALVGDKIAARPPATLAVVKLSRVTVDALFAGRARIVFGAVLRHLTLFLRCGG